jgi:hypothetical protein
MPTDNTFLIESERCRQRLSLNGRGIFTFSTLEAAEAEASRIASYVVPGSALRFELDFQWTLSDLEIRAATLKFETNSQASQKEILSCGL